MRKKIFGLAILMVGALYVMYSIHLMQATHEAKQNLSVISDPSLQEPLNTIVSDVLLKKASENDSKQAYMLIAGMVVLISGGGIVLFFRNRA